jgi:hypothetical protein
LFHQAKLGVTRVQNKQLRHEAYVQGKETRDG